MEANCSQGPLSDKVTWLAINIDDIGKAGQQMKKEHLDHLTILHVDPEVKQRVLKNFYALKYIPHCVLVDKNKIVVKNSGGFKANSLDLVHALL